MGRSHSSLQPYSGRIVTPILTRNGIRFGMSSDSLIEHIVLLRQVIQHPEMTYPGEILNYFIEEYCRRMACQEMVHRRQQSKLPWQIDWIWHVHRLHPFAYYNDCVQQLPNGKLVEKKYTRTRLRNDGNYRSVISPEPVRCHLRFVPSIDLASAVLRQCDFLQKFQQHPLFTWNFRLLSQSVFEQMVQNYVSFMKLADRNSLIVPTFEIDLIWHTHMRYPSFYQRFSKALCGFLLDHDDSIESGVLQNAYQQTAYRWKMTYNIDYGDNIDRHKLRTSQYMSNCAIITPLDTNTGNGGGCGGGS